MEPKELSGEQKRIVDLSSANAQLDISALRSPGNPHLSKRLIMALENSAIQESAEASAVPAVSPDELPVNHTDTSHHKSVARGFADAAKAAYLDGNFEDAAIILTRALAIYRSIDDLTNIAWCLNNAGKVQYRLG